MATEKTEAIVGIRTSEKELIRDYAKETEKKILVAIDLSEYASKIVRYVSEAIPAGRAKIILFHLASDIPESLWDIEKSPGLRYKFGGDRVWELQQKREMQDFMERAIKPFRSSGYSEDSVSVEVRSPKAGVARDILEEVQEEYAAAVVGRKGASTLKDLILGSVADKITNRLYHIPLCLVGDHSDPKGILVAMDTSDGAMRALDFAADFFGAPDKEFLLLHVIRGLPAGELSREELSEDEIGFTAMAKRELMKAREKMESVFEVATKKLQQRNVPPNRIKTRIVSEVASRAATITEEAKKRGCGTIVLGRRGLSKVEEFPMGRVTKKVIMLEKEKAVWIVN